MNCLSRRLVLVAACLAICAGARATEWRQVTMTDPAIRSAQLFARDGGWERVDPRSASEETEEIRAHFAAVSRILVNNTPESLGIAAARVEQAYGLSLTPQQEAKLLTILAIRREIQLERLADYARAGRFPLNRHYAGEARPIFVDARGTHCAVGHLMALDGREAHVLAIARTQPNVLVREVTDGPLVAWVLTSGLIEEEAALIQPAYYPPSTADATNLGTLVVPGATLDRNGFRYENFSFSASATGGSLTPLVSQFGLVYGWPPTATRPGIFCGNYSANCVPSPDTLWFGVYQSPTSWGNFIVGPGQSISVAIAYDVVALPAGLAVRGASTFEDPLFGGFTYFGSSLPGGQSSVATTVDGDAAGLLALLLTGPFSDNDNAVFGAPVGHVHVQHDIDIAGLTAYAAFSSFDSVTLRTVPLPAPAGLLAFALALLARLRGRAMRQ